MRMRGDEACRDEAVGAVVLLIHRLQQLPRFIAVLAAPRDLFSIADNGRVFDHTGRRAGEQPADVAKAPHLLTTVSPPTTTLVTSRPAKPETRHQGLTWRHE